MIFHLAIPAKDLRASQIFYEKLGAKSGRVYDTSIVLEFFGIQLVLHKSDDLDENPEMYPRHFGVIFDKKNQLKAYWEVYQDKDCVFKPLFTRNQHQPEEHQTFFLKDPSNNLIEFKWYKNQELIFN